MINVDSIYNQVVAISRKDSLGYSSNTDFNNQCRIVQNMLFDFYLSRYELNMKFPDSLRPFLKDPVLPVSASIVAYPIDYRHRVEVQVGVVSGGNLSYHQCHHLHGMEVAGTMNNAVRKPSVTKRRFFHILKSGSIEILPSGFNGVVKLRYLAAPTDTNRAVTIDVGNDVENYNPTGSVHFEWLPMDETNIVDLLLYLKGIQVKNSELIEWVAQKRQLTS